MPLSRGAISYHGLLFDIDAIRSNIKKPLWVSISNSGLKKIRLVDCRKCCQLSSIVNCRHLSYRSSTFVYNIRPARSNMSCVGVRRI